MTIIGPTPLASHMKKHLQASEDATAKKFDLWARHGKAEAMEKGHANSVEKILQSAKFGNKEFAFLDVGCGNGWVVRKIAASYPSCTKCIGIDKSAQMINRAKEHPHNTGIEKYYCTDIEKWRYRGQKFDYVFAMESLYYADSVRSVLLKIYNLLSPGGMFLCGMDYYAENTATKRWSTTMNIPMHLYSEKEWCELFVDAGFKTRLSHIKNPDATELWKQKMGTLLVIGTKPCQG